jgi:D-serine deaminase-like pyridoxal phosphate-dependent protein
MLTDDLSTPCLLIERGRLDENLQRMQALATANRVALRPHAKTHKSVWLAGRQRGLGARGLAVATVAEAAVFVGAGFEDVRVAYTVAGRGKHERLAALMDRARLSFCVDTPEGARAAAGVYEGQGRTADVLVEVDVGHGRCGVPWQDTPGLVALCEEIASRPGLRLAGLLAHAGQSYAGPQAGETKEEALRRVGREEQDRVLEAAARLHDAGAPGVAPGDGFELSVGSTPSLAYFERRVQDGFAVTEIRPGNYVFYDAMQVALGAAPLEACALTALATVVSKHRDRAGRERLYLDAGRKVLTGDTGVGTEGYGVVLYNPARMEPHPHARLVGLSEEHGWVLVRGGSTFEVGDRLRIVPNHACVAVHTQDVMYLVEGEEVLHEVPVDARAHRPVGVGTLHVGTLER